VYPSAAVPAIDGVSARFERGELVSVVGPSGSGKTTLMDVILGLLTPTRGSMAWSSPDSSEENSAVLAYVPQSPYIESGSVRENLGLGLPPEQRSDERFWSALEAVGLADAIREKPGGLDHHVGEAGNRLSGGQRQRLALARSLARGAHFIVLDEPTAALTIVRKLIFTIKRIEDYHGKGIEISS
jgi:ABC-type transport system involved in cytochrome bd biosynthesis fused ATPase/permease subunit